MLKGEAKAKTVKNQHGGGQDGQSDCGRALLGAIKAVIGVDTLEKCCWNYPRGRVSCFCTIGLTCEGVVSTVDLKPTALDSALARVDDAISWIALRSRVNSDNKSQETKARSGSDADRWWH